MALNVPSTERPQSSFVKRSLDKDLAKFGFVQDAARTGAARLLAPGLAIFFLAVAGGFASI